MGEEGRETQRKRTKKEKRKEKKKNLLAEKIVFSGPKKQKIALKIFCFADVARFDWMMNIPEKSFARAFVTVC